MPEAGIPATGPALRKLLRRARDGVSLNPDEAGRLLSARGADLEELCASAAAVRDAGLTSAGRPGVITFSPKVFIPLTRLCRDRCGYCTFATSPKKLTSPFLSPDEVLAIAHEGRERGALEALFTLGDRPEARWRQAREWLEAAGYRSTIEYVRAMAVRVLEETGLLPHVNAGVLSWSDLQRLKPVAPSMGLMLETSGERLFRQPGEAHFGSPDKDPAVRLRVLEDAGRCAVPFTTGVLVGIGETVAERADSLFALRRIARAYGHLQEVIIQNFQPKPDTPMRAVPAPEDEEFLATVAVARLVLGSRVRLQAPPNLADPELRLRLLRAGIDDWGGISPVTPDHVNPERPWPDLATLADSTASAGFELRARLTVYPGFLGEPWLDPRVLPYVAALAGPDGLARPGVVPLGRPWQPTAPGLRSEGRTDLHASVDSLGRSHDRRSDFDSVYGDWEAVAEHARRTSAPARFAPDVAAALRVAGDDPGRLTDAECLSLMLARGEELDAVTALADELRADAAGSDVTYVVTRNINFTNICYVGCRFCAFAQRRTDDDSYSLSVNEVGERVAEAWAVGATEICMQGGIQPDLSGESYFDLAREVKRRAPQIHLHAFSPMEVMNGVARSGLSIDDWLQAAVEAGLDSIPGTAAEILDDDVRWVLTKGKLPTASWVEVITRAHKQGIPTTATMMYGHVDHPRHWVSHLRLLGRIQAETGGFTEFVALPFVHHNAPIFLAGVARAGPSREENRAVHALARIMLHGLIRNIQCSWVKLSAEECVELLQGGVNDLGGTLMEETISRMAGSSYGSAKQVTELEALAEMAGRPARQRTTTYGSPSAERVAVARSSGGVLAGHREVAG